MGPDAAMMTPIDRIRRFMETGDGGGLSQAFAEDGVVILENFPPFLFLGREAITRWRKGFAERVKTLDLKDLRCAFGEPQDFDDSMPGAVFFTLPTTWVGTAGGRPFTEEGGWAFVLMRAGGWRVKSYAWAVTGAW